MQPIKLKRKYRDAKIVKQQKATSGNSGKNKHSKLGADQKRKLAPQPLMIMLVDGLTGRKKMVRTDRTWQPGSGSPLG